MQNVYGNNTFDAGRNTGIITRNADGARMRLMQKSQNHDGEGLQPMWITELTPKRFVEIHTISIDCLPGIETGFPLRSRLARR